MKKTVEKRCKTAVEPLLFDICSAMKNTGRESASTLFPTLTLQHFNGVPTL